MDISVVIPAKNEEGNILPLVAEIVDALHGRASFEIIYIDDGSDDATYQTLTRLSENTQCNLVVIKHRVSVGQSTAIFTGVNHAKGKLIITMDADGQNDPADIPKMLEAANAFTDSEHFCIAGYRKNRKDTPWKRFQSRIANGVRSKILRDNTPDTGCGLKIIPRKTFLQLPYFDHIHRFLPALIKRLGGKIVVVEVNHRDRCHGVSKYNMLGRLGAGVVDLIGVMWLLRRNKLAQIVPNDDI
ncbi:glycosyltransferase family 2 protein [Glaciecola sp. 1036]|uniref:glycosyltransferase family 2 protein n=1 Tax=Alteromonadaceae TaxID=72275 RepID=UPI003D014355